LGEILCEIVGASEVEREALRTEIENGHVTFAKAS
jgi:hypothetical protein